MKKLNLSSDDVYYSKKANWQYWSVSQFKDFLSCEAMALAKLKGDWKPRSDPKALLVGNYVHSYFESAQAHEKFIKENEDGLFRRDGNLYKDFEVADQMIQRVEQDSFFNFIWQGEREQVITAMLFGVKWKGKIDLLNVSDGYFIDLKTTRDINLKVYDPRKRHYVSFVEAYGYDIQMAVYEKLLEKVYGKPFEGFIYAVSKQTPSNIEAIKIADIDKETALQRVEENINHLEEVKTGQVAPSACGKCEYCRANKKVKGFIDHNELIH